MKEKIKIKKAIDFPVKISPKKSKDVFFVKKDIVPAKKVFSKPGVF